ncbi:OmpA family protein [Aureispira anguillae]|uniref:OmpA family protein n=1 Tax=Aureispira anguillae TaxID=2864201 RepID=A0A915YCX1_9BACT|nr:OmpA family protein [Aureispira anguillae]BDS10759.1 OmpA family protein [Aureispira anguillae]
MKQLFPLGYLLILMSLSSSCVSTKKFKQLEEGKQKLETTLLDTKQELSTAKRELNKLKDASSYTNEEQTEIIKSLKQQLAEDRAALDAAQAALVSYQTQLQQTKGQLKAEQQQHQKQLSPFLDVQKRLSYINSSLNAIQQDISINFASIPEIKMTQLLDKGELILTIDHSSLFASTNRLSSTGRNNLHKLAEILSRYPSVFIDIHGHMPTGGDLKENWKNSTRKTLSILYTLTQKTTLPNKIRVIGYGEGHPMVSEETPNAKHQNSRTEIILHYQNNQLLKLIPAK